MQVDFELKDYLTSAFSRRCFEEMFQEEINRACRYSESLSILLLDIDHFKSINDAFGHSRGDSVLVELVERINRTIRASDRLFRYGGDEFIVLLPGTSKSQAILAANRLKQAVAESSFPGQPELNPGISIGVASLEDSLDPETLFNKADSRLLEAKFRGRSQIIYEDPQSNGSFHLPTVSRLLDRDAAWQTATNFIAEVPAQKKAVLCIAGVHASGRTRFLREISAFAELKRFVVIFIQGQLVAKHQAFGVLETAFTAQGIDIPARPEPEDYIQSLKRYIANVSAVGCLFSVDDLPQLDRTSMNFLIDLLNRSDLNSVALAYTEDIERPMHPFIIQDALHETVEMTPLSKAAMAVWLRSMLAWEPDEKFVDWLHSETGGLPGNIERVVSYLIKRGIMIRQTANQWSFTMDYQQTQPAKRLLFQSKKFLHNLPSNLTEFIGRESEILELGRLLDDFRLVTLTGPGGSGKTRLALRVASDKINHFRDGVFFIPLESVKSPQFITSIMAEVLKFNFFGSLNPKTQLLGYLHEKEMLLVMDTFEHLLTGSDLMTEILEYCPDIRILATSRELLNIKGERIFEIPGLASTRVKGDTAAMSPAVELFVKTAQRIKPGFILNSSYLEDIQEICKLVDGMPLGIELAAGWTPVCSCKEIRSEIEKSLDFLESSQSNVPLRHRSVRAVFEQSWSHLDETEQDIIRSLSVFTGGFSRDAAEKLANASLRQLLTLKDKSFLYNSNSGRFYLLGILRQFSEEKLQEKSDDRLRIQRRHSRFYASFLKEKLEIVNNQKEITFLGDITAEIENIREGFKFAARNRITSDLPAFISGLGAYYIGLALYEEGEQVFQSVFRMMKDGLEGLSESETENMQNSLGELMLFRGIFAFNLGLFYLSRDSYQSALELFRESGLMRGLADALDGLGNVARRLGDAQKALSLHERSLSLHRSIQNTPGIAATLHNIARVMNLAGSIAQARHFYEESLAIYRELHNQRQVAAVLLDLGICLGKLGDIDLRSQYLSESLTIRKQLEDSTGIASSLDMLGFMELSLGNHAKAKQLLIESLDIRRRIHDRWGIASSLLDLGSVLKSLGEYQEARRLYEESLMTFTEIGYKRGAARVLNRLGELILQTETPEAAESFITKGRSHFEEINDKLGMCQCNLNLAICAYRTGQIQEARDICVKTVKTASEINQIEIILECLILTARLLSSGDDLSSKLKSIELLGFVSKHRVLNKESRDRMMALQREIEHSLPPDTAQTAFDTGIQLHLDTVLEQILPNET